jgi:hypothetical protein
VRSGIGQVLAENDYPHHIRQKGQVQDIVVWLSTVRLEITCQSHKYLMIPDRCDTKNVSGAQFEHFYEILLSPRPYILWFYIAP